MRRLVLITGVFFIVLLSCSRGESDLEFLYGHWKVTPGPGITLRPTVDFYENGTYRIIDYLNNTLVSQGFITGTITGDFYYAHGMITFVTASIELEDNSGVIGIPNEYISVSGGSSIGSFYGPWTEGINIGIDPRVTPSVPMEYQPVIWHVLTLSNQVLQVRTPARETITYNHQ
jgi:hypothetical protein